MPESLMDRLVEARPQRRQPAVDKPVTLELRHVTAHAPDGTTLLDDVSFHVERGSTIAVAGPTGAGKTSLARTLTGSLRVDAGTITLHGQALGDELVHGRVAYVPQEDALHTDLTLRQALEHSAVLRLPTDHATARSQHVDRSLRELGLEAHASTMVRDLSVGQRKRASIAAQLLGDPDVIVLDEPTAGLDPGYERVVLDSLRALADGGRTVVIVTHSLPALHSCDRVVFLAAGGRVAFVGPPSQINQYFEMADPADVFLALDTTDAVRFESADEPRVATGTPTTARAKTPFFSQVGMILRRDIDMLRADRRRLLLLALQAPIVGLLLLAVLPVGALAVMDHQPDSRALVVVMFLVLSTMWPGVTNAIREIVKERSITRLEVASGLSPRAYVASKVAFLGVITMAQSSLIAYLATGRQHIAGHGVLLPVRFEIVLVAAVVGVVACTLGLALSAITATPDKALALLPTTLVVQLAFAGTWTETSHLPFLHELRSVMGSRWGMEAMAGTLRGDATQWRAAILALSFLAVASLLVTITFVARATRSLATRTPVARMPRIAVHVNPHTAGAGIAVALSVAAAATGALTLGQLRNPAPAATHAATHAVANTTPATTPTLAPAVTPPTTPAPVAVTPAKTVVHHTPTTAAADETAQAADVSAPVEPDPSPTPTPEPVATTPTTVKPAATNPWWAAYMSTYGQNTGR